MSWIRICKDGIELNDLKDTVICSFSKSGNSYPIGLLLENQTIPGSLVVDLTKSYRKVSTNTRPVTIWIGSPNYSSRNGVKIKRIVLHWTASSAQSALSWFQNPQSKVSAHYLVAKDGQIFNMVEDQYKAWHAYGENSDTIGIEHEAYIGDHITPPQEQATIKLQKWLMSEYNISKNNITGHRFTPHNTGLTECPGIFFGDKSEQTLRNWVNSHL